MKYQTSYPDQIIENLASYIAQKEPYRRYILDARKYFSELVAKITDSSPDYTNRINCFLNWFLFDWPSPKNSASPYKLILLELKKDIYSLEHFQLIPHLHSLFEYIKSSNNEIVIRDLFTKKKYFVKMSPLYIEKGTYFETRIFLINKEQMLSNYFIYHPKEANRLIYQKIREHRKKNKIIKPLILQLHKCFVRRSFFKHYPIEQVYRF